VFLELSGVVFLTAREVFAAFGGFFLTTEEGRLVGFLPPSAVFFDRRGGAVKGGFCRLRRGFLTTEEGRLREVLPPSAVFF
jgi:hypothetical protein